MVALKSLTEKPSARKNLLLVPGLLDVFGRLACGKTPEDVPLMSLAMAALRNLTEESSAVQVEVLCKTPDIAREVLNVASTSLDEQLVEASVKLLLNLCDPAPNKLVVLQHTNPSVVDAMARLITTSHAEMDAIKSFALSVLTSLAFCDEGRLLLARDARVAVLIEEALRGKSEAIQQEIFFFVFALTSSPDAALVVRDSPLVNVVAKHAPGGKLASEIRACAVANLLFDGASAELKEKFRHAGVKESSFPDYALSLADLHRG